MILEPRRDLPSTKACALATLVLERLCATRPYALAALVPKNDRGALVNANVDPNAQRAAAVARIAITRSRGPIGKIGTRYITAVSVAAFFRLAPT